MMSNIIRFNDVNVIAGIYPDASLAPAGVVTPVQTHSCNVAVIGRDGKIPPLGDTDALISLCPGITVGVRTADCVPVLLHAPDIGAVAAIHAGWRGSLGGIVSDTLSRLVALGAETAGIEAAFGPSICGGCYQVSEEMVGDFRRAGFAESVIGERNIDLEAVNRRRLLQGGVPPENIHPGVGCTCETLLYPSWRRRQTPRRLLTWIALTAL